MQIFISNIIFIDFLMKIICTLMNYSYQLIYELADIKQIYISHSLIFIKE